MSNSLGSDPSPQLSPPPVDGSVETLLANLWHEIPQAQARIYQLDAPTACQETQLPSGRTLWLKREDQSIVHSYKWRGAYNKMASLIEDGFKGEMVAASAGNHAQGVALSASRLGVNATIFMPRTTPLLKQHSVRKLGGHCVDVRLAGDNYDQAAAAAKEYLQQSDAKYLHPFDDLKVIAGQATIGMELDSEVAPDLVLLEIGGGGMASGVAAAIKQRFPTAKLIGVEAEGQNSMQQSIRSGKRMTLPKVNRFCDGTAVALPGELTFQLCSHLLGDVWVVDDHDVCTAIEWLWDEIRAVVEPSAGIGVAAALAADQSGVIDRPEIAAAFTALGLGKDATILTVLSGANVDFLTLPSIARKGRLSLQERRYYRFEIPERSGTLIGLLDQFLSDMNIIDFQYGKTKSDRAFPVIGIEGPKAELNEFEKRMELMPLHFKPVTDTITVEYRLVPFNLELASHPLFATIEFPDRPGALGEFMRQVVGQANVCYFNYTETRQSVGQALMGFEFQTLPQRKNFLDSVEAWNIGFREIETSSISGL